MYTDILRRIAGIEVFPVVSLLLFVSVFTIALVWTVRLDTARVLRLARLPLDEPETDQHIDAPSAARRDA
jgi:hypothetical protein